MKKITKNCFNCKYLEYVDSGGCEYQDDFGFTCSNPDKNYRNDYEKDLHYSKMEDDKYLKTSKKCCVLKEIKTIN